MVLGFLFLHDGRTADALVGGNSTRVSPSELCRHAPPLAPDTLLQRLSNLITDRIQQIGTTVMLETAKNQHLVEGLTPAQGLPVSELGRLGETIYLDCPVDFRREFRR